MIHKYFYRVVYGKINQFSIMFFNFLNTRRSKIINRVSEIIISWVDFVKELISVETFILDLRVIVLLLMISGFVINNNIITLLQNYIE